MKKHRFSSFYHHTPLNEYTCRAGADTPGGCWCLHRQPCADLHGALDKPTRDYKIIVLADSSAGCHPRPRFANQPDGYGPAPGKLCATSRPITGMCC